MLERREVAYSNNELELELEYSVIAEYVSVGQKQQQKTAATTKQSKGTHPFFSPGSGFRVPLSLPDGVQITLGFLLFHT